MTDLNVQIRPTTPSTAQAPAPSILTDDRKIVSQAFFLGLLTRRGSRTLNRDFGTVLPDLIGKPQNGVAAVSAIVQQESKNLLAWFRADNPAFPVSSVSSSVVQGADPGVYDATIRLSFSGGEPETLTITV